MYKSILFLCIMTMLANCTFAQASFTSTGYSQNFDGMGTGTSMPLGWSHLYVSGEHDNQNGLGWTNTTGIPSSGTRSAAGGVSSNTLVVNSNAGSSGYRDDNQAYNLAFSGSTGNRSLGTSPTGNAGNILQLVLRNNSASSFNSFIIRYTIRRFTTSASQDHLPGYRLFYSFNGSTWTNVTVLNPVSSGSGVVVPNTVGNTVVSNSVINFASGATWSVNSLLYLRFVDDNATNSPDQVIGLDDFTATVPAGAGLPVKYKDFTAQAVAGQTRLSWVIPTCEDLVYCEVESGADGKNFQASGRIAAQKEPESAYRWIEQNGEQQKRFYRIRFVYENGSSDYSRMIAVSGQVSTGIRAYPTVVSDHVNLEMSPAIKGRVGLRGYDALGKLIFEDNFIHPGGQYLKSFQLPATLLPGIFLLHIRTESGATNVIKLVKE